MTGRTGVSDRESPPSTPGVRLVDIGLDHPRGGAAIASGANLTVSPGEVAVIVAASGAGTSRLVAAMLGEYPIATGAAHVLGRDVGKLRRASLRLLRRRIGVVPQDLCLLDDRSAQHNAILPLEIDGIPRATSLARSGDVLARLGLADDAHVRVDQLSPSARQRVAVARALVRTPDVVIADHPTTAQDVPGVELVCGAIADAARAGAACIVVSRDPSLRAIGEELGWSQYLLAHGELRALGVVQIDSGAIDRMLVDLASAPVEHDSSPYAIAAGAA